MEHVCTTEDRWGYLQCLLQEQSQGAHIWSMLSYMWHLLGALRTGISSCPEIHRAVCPIVLCMF